MTSHEHGHDPGARPDGGERVPGGAPRTVRYRGIRFIRRVGAVDGTSRFNSAAAAVRRMSMEIERYCPECDGERTFWRAASTELHLGRKVKWHCAECDYGFVRIGESVDTGVDA
jgi:rubredoxin